jgi:hypothetical protein
LKYIRRFVWYLASRLALCCCLIGVMTVVFYYAMNFTNMYVVIGDGMAMRAKIVMGVSDEVTELPKFFQQSCLERDEILLRAINGENTYSQYDISGIDHRVNMSWMWCWPWDTSARVDFTESVPGIDGRIKSEYKQAAVEAGKESGTDLTYPPKWTTTTYRAQMVRENGRWYIKNLTIISQQ